ncbi:DUF3172 domain-containing protein [Leptolyngbyaceae cyanobacterium UHCC 1019]
MAKRRPRSSIDNYERDREFEREYDDYSTPEPSNKPPRKPEKSIILNATSLAILAGVLILGIGIGMGFSSVGGNNSSTGTKIVTQSDLDNKAPNPEICVQFGASAIVTDLRVFVTLNPLNFYVSQPTSRPGCVLRTNNWSILEQRNLVDAEQVRECKRRMNTFGFTGALESSPDISCIYQNDLAKNLFLDQNGPDGKPVAEPDNKQF